MKLRCIEPNGLKSIFASLSCSGKRKQPTFLGSGTSGIRLRNSDEKGSERFTSVDGIREEEKFVVKSHDEDGERRKSSLFLYIYSFTLLLPYRHLILL